MDTKRLSRNLLIYLAVALLVGCGSAERKSGHTHVWIGDQAQNVWSYELVESIVSADGEETESVGFLSAELKPGDEVTLSSGVVIKYDGSALKINGQKVVDSNVVVEMDGAIRRNAFIRARE